VTVLATESPRAAPPSAILLVEDEPVLRSSLARGLSKLNNVDVLAAGTVDEAVAFLGTHEPSLLISDIDLPGASGLELVAEFGRRDIDVPIILVTAYLHAYRHKIPAKPNVLVLEKPIPLEDLRTRVKQLLRTAGGLRPPFNLLDCVELARTSRTSARIDVELANGAARVFVYEGEVWSATDDQGSGPSAFQRLAFVPDTAIHYGALVGEPEERNITTRWEQLVLDLACVLERPQPPRVSKVDSVVGSATPPGQRPFKSRARTLSGIPQVRPENMRACPAAATFDELWALGVEALLNREHAVAARAFRAAGELRHGHPGVLANLRRLKEMGYDTNNESDGDN
jgi:DNA-binding response OmpR family regulator